VPKPERTLRKEDVADIYDVHPNTVLKWAREGCPHSKTGTHGAYAFNKAEIEQWLQAKGRNGLPGRPVESGPSRGFARARLQHEVEKALLTRTKRLKAEGALHDVNECRQRRLKQIHAVKASLLSLPRSVSPDLVKKRKRQIEAILLERVKDIIRQFANGEDVDVD